MLAAISLIDARLASGHVIRRATAAARDVYIVSQLLAAGVVAYACVALWRRFGPRSRLAAYAAVTVVSLAVTVPALTEDLSILAGKIGLPYAIAHALLVAGVAAAVPVAALLGWLSAKRRWLRFVGVGLALAMAVANHLVLPDDYAGMHLVAAIAAATLCGASIATPDAPAGGRASRIALGVLALVGAASVVVPPRSSVAVAIFRVPGEVVAPWLARLRERFDDDADTGAPTRGAISVAPAAWFESRLGRPPIPPSKPSILPANPILIFITIDCMRASLIWDEDRPVALPAIDELRRESLSFTDTHTTAPSTAQAIGALFSGRYYSELYWKPWPGLSAESVYPYADPAPRFAELLAGAGVETVSFFGMPALVNRLGIVRGMTEEHEIRRKSSAAGARALMTPLLTRLHRPSEHAMFVYIHFTDAHAPYDLAGVQGTPYERYLGGLQAIDAELASLFAMLGDRPDLRARTAIVLSADHGEAFGEHHQSYHATSLYEEVLRVPLLVHVPGVEARRITTPVSLIDLAPTLLDLFGVPTPGELMGQSLVPFFRGEAPTLTRPIAADGSRMMRAMIFPDGFKIIHDRRKGTVELYDLNHDPQELHELLDESGREGDERLEALRAFFRVHSLKRDGYRVPYGR